MSLAISFHYSPPSEKPHIILRINIGPNGTKSRKSIANNQTKQILCNKIKANIAQCTQPINYSKIAESVSPAAIDTLPKIKSANSDWFYDSKSSILPSIKLRNIKTKQYFKNRTPQNKQLLRAAQRRVKYLVRSAKNNWLTKLANTMNAGSSHCSFSKSSWK